MFVSAAYCCLDRAERVVYLLSVRDWPFPSPIELRLIALLRCPNDRRNSRMGSGIRPDHQPHVRYANNHVGCLVGCWSRAQQQSQPNRRPRSESEMQLELQPRGHWHPAIAPSLGLGVPLGGSAWRRSPREPRNPHALYRRQRDWRGRLVELHRPPKGGHLLGASD